MAFKARPTAETDIVRRALPDAADLADARFYAWEILRRRADYQATPATIETVIADPRRIELVRSARPAVDGRLRFRRAGGTNGIAGSLVLGLSP